MRTRPVLLVAIPPTFRVGSARMVCPGLLISNSLCPAPLCWFRVCPGAVSCLPPLLSSCSCLRCSCCTCSFRLVSLSLRCPPRLLLCPCLLLLYRLVSSASSLLVFCLVFESVVFFSCRASCVVPLLLLCFVWFDSARLSPPPIFWCSPSLLSSEASRSASLGLVVFHSLAWLMLSVVIRPLLRLGSRLTSFLASVSFPLSGLVYHVAAFSLCRCSLLVPLSAWVSPRCFTLSLCRSILG